MTRVNIKTVLLLWCLIPGVTPSFGQRVITLGECYEKACSASPVAEEKVVHAAVWQLKDASLAKEWLPSLDASGNVVYNSSVVDFSGVLGSLPIPGIGSLISPMPHEQYKVNLEINQMIYDGGAVKGARALEKATLDISMKQTEADLYALRSQINSSYFHLLLLDRQRELLATYHEIIEKRITSLGSAVENGLLLPSDVDVLSSEKLRLEQQLTENRIRNSSLLRILSDLTGIETDTTTVLALPRVDDSLTREISRPELEIFDLKKEHLEASQKVIGSKRLPKAFGFATLGYGNPPGSNFFKDEFAPYYIVGAGVKWTIWDWDKIKNEKKVVALQQELLEGRKQDLTGNLERLLVAKSAEISSLEALVATDAGIIGLRKRITAAAESQYANGTITATDYLNELNAEKQALINHEIHKISLVMARVEYLNISGVQLNNSNR